MIEIGDQQQTQQEVGEEIGDIFEMAKIMGVQRFELYDYPPLHFRPATLASWSQPGWNTVKKKNIQGRDDECIRIVVNGHG